MEESGRSSALPSVNSPESFSLPLRPDPQLPSRPRTLLQLLRLKVSVVLHRVTESDTKSLTIWRHSSSHAVSLSSQKSVKTLRLVSEPLLPAPQLFQGTLKEISSTDTHSPPPWMFFKDLVLIPKARKQLSPWATSTEPTCCKSRSPSILEPRDPQQEKPRH